MSGYCNLLSLSNRTLQTINLSACMLCRRSSSFLSRRSTVKVWVDLSFKLVHLIPACTGNMERHDSYHDLYRPLTAVLSICFQQQIPPQLEQQPPPSSNSLPPPADLIESLSPRCVCSCILNSIFPNCVSKKSSSHSPVVASVV